MWQVNTRGVQGRLSKVWYLPVGKGPRWSSVDNRSPGRSGRGRGPANGILPGKGNSCVGYSRYFIRYRYYRYAVVTASMSSVGDVSVYCQEVVRLSVDVDEMMSRSKE